MRRLWRGIAAAIATLCAFVLTAPPPAHAFSAAFFPTQSVGNRGVDVEALQYLLQQSGATVTADGVFGSTTETAVKGFQSSRGFGADGIVGPTTWGALVVTLQQGANGPAVRGLQVQLNEKHTAGLAVSGQFDAATRTAVVAFQRHAGLTADGWSGRPPGRTCCGTTTTRI